MSVIKCCKDCEKRQVGCHVKCEQYNSERDTIIKERGSLKKDTTVFAGRAYTTAKKF